MSKLSDNYRTLTTDFWDKLNEVTPFFWDACCTKENCLVEWQKAYLDQYDYLESDLRKEYNFYTQLKTIDPIGETVFINPPYSRGSVGPIIQKAWEDAKHFRVVMLLKADMSTDWFNYILNESDQYTMNHQELKPLRFAYEDLLQEMLWHPSKGSENRVGILHLRKRVKFLADEEMMEADTNAYMRTSNNRKVHYLDKYNNENHDILLETKNFKRGSDGLIYPKSGPTFPSMIVVLDRRGDNGQ